MTSPQALLANTALRDASLLAWQCLLFLTLGEAHAARCSVGKLMSWLSEDGFYVTAVARADIFENSLVRLNSYRQAYEFLLSRNRLKLKPSVLVSAFPPSLPRPPLWVYYGVGHVNAYSCVLRSHRRMLSVLLSLSTISPRDRSLLLSIEPTSHRNPPAAIPSIVLELQAQRGPQVFFWGGGPLFVPKAPQSTELSQGFTSLSECCQDSVLPCPWPLHTFQSSHQKLPPL